MKCQICGADATVHLTQIIGGKIQKIELCESCSKTKGVADPTGFSLADMLLGLGVAETMKSNASDELTCPECGFTQPDFKKTGRMGCPYCYTTFAVGIADVLKDMHKGSEHKGKVPSRYKHNAGETRARIAELQRELEKAVTDEKYELAASLRDKIQQLQEGM